MANKTRKDDNLLEAGPFTNQSPPPPPPPPPFEQQPTEPSRLDSNHYNTFNLNIDEEPPPNFSPYLADYFETGTGDIVSHDQHLNTDGEALYRFLLAQANRNPLYRLHCRGTHTEHRARWVRETNSDGRTESRRETYTETVTDFDFYIDAGPHLSSKPVHWSVADNEPAYRGLMVKEIELCGVRQTIKEAEKKRHNKWAQERKVRGLPPWVTSIDEWFEGLPDDPNSLKSSKTLRQWADEYCASQKYLKEFRYEKVLYGWNLQQIELAVRSAIQATMYQGFIEVEIKTHGSKIYIRPDNKLSRMLSNKWLKFLSIILLIFPLIWLFKRFHSRGGGRWEICGGAYALKRWVPAQTEDTIDDVSQLGGSGAALHTPSTSLRQTPNGVTRVVGFTEGEWFRRWEPAIIRGVMSRYQSSMPIFDAGDYNF